MVLSCDNIILTISHLFVVVNMSYLTSTVTRKVHMTFIMIFTELRHTKPTLEVPDCQERNTKTDQPRKQDHYIGGTSLRLPWTVMFARSAAAYLFKSGATCL